MIMIVTPTNKIKSILTAVDFIEKIPIIIKELEDADNVIVVDPNDGIKGYYINSSADNLTMPIVDAVSLAGQAVRFRAQIEKDPELFPFLSIDQADFAKDFLQRIMETSPDGLPEIDYEVFGGFCRVLWQKKGIKALPLVKKLAPLNASEIILQTKPILGLG